MKIKTAFVVPFALLLAAPAVHAGQVTPQKEIMQNVFDLKDAPKANQPESTESSPLIIPKIEGKDPKAPLTNTEIDTIFLSFLKEKAKKEAEKKKKEREKANAARAKPAAKKRYYGMNNEELELMKSAIQNGAMAHKSREKKKKESFKAKPINFYIYGVSCDHDNCVIFTSLGILKKGSKVLQTEEKILDITPRMVKTSLRTLPI
jgi:hypothetical protein